MMLTLAQDIRIIENFGGTEWANQTTLHPIGLAMTALCGLTALLVPRRFAIWPFIVMACFVAPAQRLVVGGLDFNLIRLMVLFGFVRVMMRSEHRGVRWIPMDFVIIGFAAVRTIAYTVQQSSMSGFIFQAGQTFDAVGLYFLFRLLIRNWDDVVRTVAGFAVIAVPVVIAFVIEHQTGRNAFAFFGGVPEITMIREGRRRCQGAFAHPIIGGCFWASLIPLFAALWWWGPRNRPFAVIGVVCGLGIVGLSASSTPVMGVLMGAFGGAMFFLRRRMKIILAAVAVLMVFLHLSMKAPIWHLISRINIAQGNTGYHRFQLIDNAVRRFGEWGAFGTKSTAHWFFGGQDVTNHYILEGVRGGILTLALFVTIITLGYIAVGQSWRIWAGDKARLYMSWALGVSLFVHCTNFVGVSYFGQGVFIWFLLLAMIASMLEWSRHVQVVRGQRAAAMRRFAAAAAEQAPNGWSTPAPSGGTGL